MQIPVSRLFRRRLPALAAVAACASFVGVAGTASAAGGSPAYYVDGASLSGACSDSHTAAQAENPSTPWCTISHAVASVPQHADVRVAPAVYHEEVTLTPADDYITLEGVGATRPVIEGDFVRRVGLQLINGVHDVALSGFEIRDLQGAGLGGQATGILSQATTNDTIQNNVIHAVHGGSLWAYGMALGTNQTPGSVQNLTIENNRIYDIGPGGESMGIWLLMTKNMNVTGNEIYLVRKEGIRDWCGLDNSFVSNRMYLNWIGINLESAVGDYVANNDAYNNVWGYNPKHVNDPKTLSIWGLSSPQWTKFWHNTSYDNTHADIGLGMNAPVEDYIDVRDNVFSNPGDVHLHDFPSVHGPNMIVDGNVYSGSAPLYYTNWNMPKNPIYTTLAQLQSAVGWDHHGQIYTPAFQNTIYGNFNFNSSGLAAGITLPDAYGAQLGTVGVPAATNAYQHYPTQVIASTPEQLAGMKPQNAGDGQDDSYWWSASATQPSGSITFDLGTAHPLNTFVVDLFSHLDPRNPRAVAIEVSNNNVNYTTVLNVTNPDSEGSSYKYELPSPVTARYVKLDLNSSFGASSIVLSDFEIGLLSSAANPTPAVGAPHPTALLATTASRRQRRHRHQHRHRHHHRRHHRSHRVHRTRA